MEVKSEVLILACSSKAHGFGDGTGCGQGQHLPQPPVCVISPSFSFLAWRLVLTWLCDASQVLGEEHS